MNRAELVNEVAERTGSKKAEVSRIVNAVFEVMRDAFRAGERVTIVGFGSFRIVDRAARTGRDPKTGKPIEIPARKVVRFKPGKNLKVSG